jgi:hypothetical protein
MEPKVADDLLWGVKAIAKEIGQSERMTYWRPENGQLPAGKTGNVYVASRQALRKFFQELTTKAARPTHRTAKKTGMKKAVSA